MEPEDERGDAVGEPDGDDAERAARVAARTTSARCSAASRRARWPRPRGRGAGSRGGGAARERAERPGGVAPSGAPRAGAVTGSATGLSLPEGLHWPAMALRDGGFAHRRRPHDRGRLGGRGRRRRARRSRIARASKMRAAREVVERAAHGATRAHLRRQHRLRPLRLAVDPGGADRGAAAPAPAQPRLRGRRAVPGRGRPRGDAAARERAREGLLRRPRRDRRAAARVPEPRRRPARPGPRLGRRERRSRAARAPRAAARRRGRGDRRGGAAAGRARRWRAVGPGAGAARRRRRGSRSINGTQFMAAIGALGLVRARRLAKIGRHRVRDVARGAAGLADELPPADPRAAPAARAGALGGERARACSRARRSSSRTAGATRCRTRTRCAARRRCTAPRATCSTTSSARSRSRSTPPPTTRSCSSRSDVLVSNGNFHGQPLAFALDALAMAVAELASISERRVERLVNPSLSDGLPAFLTARRRPQLGLHDPAVRGRVARQREQGALRTRRASTRSRRARARRITSRWATPPG